MANCNFRDLDVCVENATCPAWDTVNLECMLPLLCPYNGLVDCIGIDCAVWDIDNVQCGALVSNCIRQPTNEINSLIEYLESSVGKPSERDTSNSIIVYLKNIFGISSERDDNSSIIVYLKNILGLSTEKNSAEGTGSSILREINHIHGAHFHCNHHDCSTIPASCGQYAQCSTSSAAAMLINEFLSNVDMDNNDKVYGNDFVIESTQEKPPSLVAIENSPEWITPQQSIAWDDYSAWFSDPDHYPDPTI